MSEPRSDSFLPALQDLVHWWDTEQISAVLIGGFAVSMIAAPRATHDLDALVLVEDGRWPQLLETAAGFGFQPRTKEPLEFAAATRMLLLRHEPTGVDVDLTLGVLPFEAEAVDQAVRFRIEGVELPIASPEALLVMKVVAGRPKDLLDAAALIKHRPRLDRRRVDFWVDAFAAALEEPELTARLKRLWSEADSGLA